MNAIGVTERRGLLDAATKDDRSPHTRTVVLMGEGRTFAAGAHAREFDGEPLRSHLLDVANDIEASQSTGIAAIRGPVWAGGLEIALACDKGSLRPMPSPDCRLAQEARKACRG